MGVSCGGLGLPAIGAAPPAFLVSRAMCRPLVTATVGRFCAAFGTPSQPIPAEYDTRTDEALSRLVCTLTVAVAQDLLVEVGEALPKRGLLWRSVLTGTDDAMRDLPTLPAARTRHHL